MAVEVAFLQKLPATSSVPRVIFNVLSNQIFLPFFTFRTLKYFISQREFLYNFQVRGNIFFYI